MEEATIKFLNKSFVIAAVLILGVLVFFVGDMIYKFKSLEQTNAYQITVSGDGKVYAKPDIALVSLGVNTTGKTTQDVITRNTEKMNAVIEAVKSLGVEEKDIQTTNYNLYPSYNYTEAAGRVFEGYELNQSLEVKIRDFTKVGEILQKATTAGANLTSNLQFTIEDQQQYKQEARAKAIEQAKANAENLAKVSGVKLGKLVNIYENYSYTPTYSTKSAYGMGGGVALEQAASPTIQSGQQEIQMTINLVYEVK